MRGTLYLNLGEMIVTTEPVVITTVLGSCVSVCLFSEKIQIGGMIHFALPNFPKGRMHEDFLRYGSKALPLLIQKICEIGNCVPKELQAKIVGGAEGINITSQEISAGSPNIAIAEKILSQYQIPLVGRQTGGTSGRKVLFYVPSGRLRVAKINPNAKEQQAHNPLLKVKPSVPVSPPLKQTKPVKVLIVDDSRTICQVLTHIFSKDPAITVVGSASNPVEAMQLIPKLKPQVITLDIQMPQMDGLTFLEKHLPEYPLPTIMISSISRENGETVLKALELGAVDYIEKPSFGDLLEKGPLICQKVKEAASAKLKVTSSKLAPARIPSKDKLDTSFLVAIGASTGGTQAIKQVLLALPEAIPPIVIVQHIPPVFSTAFARRLNEQCPFKVKEAQDGDWVEKGQVLIAPGGAQMALKRTASGLKVQVFDGPKVNGHKPSVDVLFESVAQHVGRKAVGVILTGMGNDGARGLLKMRQAGARTVGQDEESCIVFGMPKEAFRLGGVETLCELNKVAAHICSCLKAKSLVA